MAGEFDFLDWVRTQQEAGKLVQVPAGDDLAVLKWAAEDLLVVGVDQVLDGVHFDSRQHEPRLIGRKVMNRNLSDCGAMGCLPAAALASVALPKGTSLDYAKELYRGLRDAADPFYCPMVGGDTSSWEGKLAMSVTILARSAGAKPVLRSGAKPGDSIFVTGPLGGSILGRHMTFSPRVFVGHQLAKSGLVTAMIDLSDGVSRDLAHVCEQSGVGALIDGAAIPIHDDAIAVSRTDRRYPLDHALHDGEDYELLFTGPDSFFPTYARIGMITASPGIQLMRDGVREKLVPQGWEHQL